jgi:hypothetical protein
VCVPNIIHTSTRRVNSGVCHGMREFPGFSEPDGPTIINDVKPSRLLITALALALVAFNVIPCRAENSASNDTSSGLGLATLADRAKARQASYDRQLATLREQNASSAQIARVEDLRARNARVLSTYENRLAGAAAPATAAAAPGGGSDGLMSKLGGLFGASPASPGDAAGGPVSDAYGSGGTGGAVMGWLKNNWPNLVGSLVGSIGGAYLGRMLTGGNKLGALAGGIVGSFVGGWVADKIAKMVKGHGGGGGGGMMAGMGNSVSNLFHHNAPPAQTRPPSGGATDLASAQSLMNSRYQQFMAASAPNTDANARASAFQSFMEAKSQFETLKSQQGH